MQFFLRKSNKLCNVILLIIEFGQVLQLLLQVDFPATEEFVDKLLTLHLWCRFNGCFFCGVGLYQIGHIIDGSIGCGGLPLLALRTGLAGLLFQELVDERERAALRLLVVGHTGAGLLFAQTIVSCLY